MKQILLTGMSGTGKSTLGDWVWREDRIDAIVLLSAPKDVVLKRLATRTNNDYGKRPEEEKDVLNNIDNVEPLLRRVAHHEIETSAPLEEVVTQLLELVGADHSIPEATGKGDTNSWPPTTKQRPINRRMKR